MVSFDTNSQEMQFLQGWLMHDRFLLRSTLGIPYEFWSLTLFALLAVAGVRMLRLR